MDNQSSVKALMEDVLQKSPHPQDKFEVAALLESLGWNDNRASKEFGVEDIFELSQLIKDMIGEEVSFIPIAPEEEQTSRQKIELILRSFIRGLIFALPMAISVIAMLELRFALWSYEKFTVDRATAIAIGTILSFISVGGFTQAIARRGFFYINQGFYNMARKTIFYFVRMGYGVCIIIGVIIAVCNMFTQIFPTYIIVLMELFYFFLTSNWLSVTVMYVLKKEFTFTLLLTAGIGVVYVLFHFFDINIVMAQIIALTCISICGTLMVLYYFNKAEAKLEKGIAPTMKARKSLMLYEVSPYFIYGLLYFAFLYIDRIIAWSRNDIFMPYMVWFKGEYELGLDFALLTIIIPMGFSEIMVNRLMQRLESNQKNDTDGNTTCFNRKYSLMYFRSIAWTLVVSAISSLILFFVIRYLNSTDTTIFNTSIKISKITMFVFTIAVISYTILSIALTNAVILFSLSQPKLVSRVIFKAVIINSVLGFFASRWFGNQYAVFGLLAGTIYFTYASTKSVLKVVRNLDYYIYVTV